MQGVKIVVKDAGLTALNRRRASRMNRSRLPALNRHKSAAPARFIGRPCFCLNNRRQTGRKHPPGMMIRAVENIPSESKSCSCFNNLKNGYLQAVLTQMQLQVP